MLCISGTVLDDVLGCTSPTRRLTTRNLICTLFGVDLNKDVGRGVLTTYYRPAPDAGGPSWLTFPGQMKDSLWSIHLQTPWVLVVMDQFTRRIIWLPGAPWGS